MIDMVLGNFKDLNTIKDNAKKPIVKLKDVNIIEISTDSFSYSGCETCDYGSSYINEIHFWFDDGTSELFQISQEYSYICSEQDLILFFINNLDALAEITKEELSEIFEEENRYTLIKMLNEESWFF